MSELNGQMAMELSGDRQAEAAVSREDGWDAQGRLINPALEDERRLDVLAGQINMLEGQAKETFRRTAIEIGKRLIEARGLVQEGRWELWLREHVDYSVRKAQQLMQVAENYAGRALPEAYDRLSFTQIYDLLAAPAEERDSLAQAAADEDWSTRDLKRQIDEANERYRAAQQSIFDLHQQVEIGEAAIRREREAAEQYRADAEAAAQSADIARADADRERQRAKDAIERATQANDKRRAAEQMEQTAKAELAKAAEEMDALRRRPPEVVEVTPKSITDQLEAAKAIKADMDKEIARLQAEAAAARAEAEAAKAGNAMPEDEKRAMMLASLIRINSRDAREKIKGAVDALKGLRAIDNAKADMLAQELRHVLDWAQGQMD